MTLRTPQSRLVLHLAVGFFFLGLTKVVIAVQLDPIPHSLGALSTSRGKTLKIDGSLVVVNQSLAVVLGKGIFWDMQIGRAGVACATCHHHAGIDSRLYGQLRGARLGTPSASEVDLQRPHPDLFPFVRKTSEKKTPSSSASRVMGSAGVFRSMLDRGHGTCQPLTEVREVTIRNTPSVINAAFYQRLFWDGRANSTFNGLDASGLRNPMTQGVHRTSHGMKAFGAISNAALASQALSPLKTPGEMVCDGETLVDIARRILPLKILSGQRIHNQDGVLGPYRASNGYGLRMTYRSLFQKVFAESLWQPLKSHRYGIAKKGSTDTNIETNFGLMMGLALMAYEKTLISDQTPFDAPRDKDGYPSGYSPEERRGLDLFNRLECDFCHSGAVFSAAAINGGAGSQSGKWVDRRVIAPDLAHHDAQMAFLDVGFANIGVSPSEEDLGVGGSDEWGLPFSYSEQYLQTLQDPDKSMVDRIKVNPESFSIGFNMDFQPSELIRYTKNKGSSERAWRPNPMIAINEGRLAPQKRLGLAVRGAFKIPSLRNVELTGPYMHNGSMKSLEEVIDFYDRGGNFPNPEKIATFVHPQRLSEEDKRDLKAFLLTLTDERVRWERSPFDHPELRIPTPSFEADKGKAKEQWQEIPSVGRHGRSPMQGPLRSFDARITADHRLPQ